MLRHFLAACLAQLLSEVLAHHLFALLPESLCVLGVECIAPHTFVKQAEPCIICDDVTHVAVLAIPSSYLFGGRDDRCPLLIFIDYIAAKKIIAPALNAMAGGPSRVFQQATQVMEEAAHALASHAIASSDLRPDVDPIDLMRAIYGLSTGGSADDWPAKARKFVDILLQGSRP